MYIKSFIAPSEHEVEKWLSSVFFPVFECDVKMAAAAFVLLNKAGKHRSNAAVAGAKFILSLGYEVINTQVWRDCIKRAPSSDVKSGIKFLGIFCVTGSPLSLNLFTTFDIKRDLSPFFTLTPIFLKLSEALKAFKMEYSDLAYAQIKCVVLKLLIFAEECGITELSQKFLADFLGTLSFHYKKRCLWFVGFLDRYFNLRWEDPETEFPYNPLPLPSLDEAELYFASLEDDALVRIDMLIVKACQALRDYGESESSVGQYLKIFRRFWWKSLRVEKEHYLPELYDEYLAFEQRLTDRGEQLQWKLYIAQRSGAVLAAVAATGTIPVDIFAKKLELPYPELEFIREKLIEHCIEDKGFSKAYADLFDFVLRKIFAACNITTVVELKALDHKSLDRILMCFQNKYKVSSRSTLLPLLQAVLTWLYECDYVVHNLSCGVLRPHYIKTHTPPYLKIKDQAKLLELIKNESWRTRSIILLLTETGLRECDVIRLRKEDLDFRHKKLSIIQQKTKSALELPISDELIEAIRHYLKEERPRPYVKSEPIFLNSCAPFKPMTSVYWIVKKTTLKADVHPENGTARGPHMLRYSLAHAMMYTQTDHKVMTDTLGHQSKDSDRPYLSMNEEMLLKCALDLSSLGMGRYGKKEGK